MKGVRTVENSTLVLERGYKLAEASGLFQKVENLCRSYGDTLHDNATEYTGLYRLILGRIGIFYDSDKKYITVYESADLVCNTFSENKIFIYGEWVNWIEALYDTSPSSPLLEPHL